MPSFDPRPGLTRRQFLGGSAVAAGGMVLSGLNGPRASAATTTPTGQLEDIEHVIIWLQENRSFDHYFGCYPDVRGYGDPGAMPGVFVQDDAGATGGKVGPFHLDTSTDTPMVQAECDEDIPHDWGGQHQSWDGGKMDDFGLTNAGDHDQFFMGYYDRSDLGYYYQLADTFTLCDAYHCSVLGPTTPNRLYAMTGMIDPNGLYGGPVESTVSVTSAIEAQYGIYSDDWQTYPEALTEAGVTWKVYASPDGDDQYNPLLLFKQYYPMNYPAGSEQFVKSTELLANTAPDFPGNFLADLAAGTLPQVSWIIPDIIHSEHPAAAPQDGMSLVSTIVEALTVSPLWDKLAMFLTYDENGGFFDHVPPPVPPAGTADEYVGGDPIGLGFRVPAIIVSPYSQGGFVCRDTFDHTSLLRFIETRFGVTAPNITPWRRQTVGDLTSAFNFAAPVPTPPVLLPVPGVNPTLEAACAEEEAGGSYGTPYPTAADQAPPQQETGSRPSPNGLGDVVAAALPESSLPAGMIALGAGLAATTWLLRRRTAVAEGQEQAEGGERRTR